MNTQPVFSRRVRAMAASLALVSATVLYAACVGLPYPNEKVVDVNACGTQFPPMQPGGALPCPQVWESLPPLDSSQPDPTGRECCGPGIRQHVIKIWFDCIFGNDLAECEYQFWYPVADASCS